MRKLLIFSALMALLCLGCQWQMRPQDEKPQADEMVVDRFDRVEANFLALADFAALHQMKTDYPEQTRTLVEDVLQLGPVNAPDLNSRLLTFFQDTTLQTLITEVGRQYGDMTDVNRQLASAFGRLAKMMPGMKMPRVYAQIGSLDQSIVVRDSLLGISLDKYLGENYAVYLRYGYTSEQRRMMTRSFIVPDCLGFFLLSACPLQEPADGEGSLSHRHWHMQKIQAVVNHVMGQQVFANDTVSRLQHYIKSHPGLQVPAIMQLDSLPR